MFPFALFAAVAVNMSRTADEDTVRRRTRNETHDTTADLDDRIQEIGDSMARQMRREDAALTRARETEKPDLIDLCDVFDVAVREQRMDDDLCGWIEEYDHLDSRRCRIIVNSSHPEWRRRFTIAAMLGHHHYHRDLFDRRAGSGANAGRSYVQVEGSPFWNPAIDADCERRASVFAIQLLMPRKTMLRLVEEGLDAPAIARRLCLSEKVAQKRMETLRD